MLQLVFELGDERLALDHRAVVEVVPAIPLTTIRRAPAYLAGLLNYRGAAVPVVDLQQVALGRPARARLSTRMVIVRSADGGLLGLLVERALECRDTPDGTSPIARSDATGSWRQVEVDELLPAELSEVLRHGL